MALPHADPGQIISVDSDPASETRPGTKVLLKTRHMEVIRLELSQGRTIPRHQAPGELIVQCLHGAVRFTTMGRTIELLPGQMFFLEAGEPHDVHALEDCRFLLTILLANAPPPTTPPEPGAPRHL